MLQKINLSYIIATRNRLPFLKITLQRLLEDLQHDEEVVLVDGNSTDGTKEHVQQLFNEGKIHQFISEPDKNQAHGWNKALLMARGTIIKKVIDDDVFCYEAISKCKNYMLMNPAVDVVISNDLGCSLHDYKNVQKFSRLSQFKLWNNGLTPSFTFGDVHLLIRRSALAYVGLYNTGYIMMDWEYSLRLSYFKANITYYTGCNALSVSHPQTVSRQKNAGLVSAQGKRANAFYEYAGDYSGISLWSKIKIYIGKKLYNNKVTAAEVSSAEDINLTYDYLYNHISEINNSAEFSFIKSDHSSSI